MRSRYIFYIQSCFFCGLVIYIPMWCALCARNNSVKQRHDTVLGTKLSIIYYYAKLAPVLQNSNLLKIRFKNEKFKWI